MSLYELMLLFNETYIFKCATNSYEIQKHRNYILMIFEHIDIISYSNDFHCITTIIFKKFDHKF